MHTKPNIIGIHGKAGSGKDTAADRFVYNGYVKIALADPIKRLAQACFGFNDHQLWGSSAMRNYPDPRAQTLHDSISTKIGRAFHEERKTTYIEEFVRKYQNSYSLNISVELQVAAVVNGLHSHSNSLVSPRDVLCTLGDLTKMCLGHDVYIDIAYETALQILHERATYTPQKGLSYPALREEQPAGVVISDVRYSNEAAMFYENEFPIIHVVRNEGTLQSTHSSEQGIPDHCIHKTIFNTEDLAHLYKEVDNLVTQYYV